jgi:hypothetical protein
LDYQFTKTPSTAPNHTHIPNAQRYIVIPQRPEGTEGWPEERLRRLVTRDSLIGVRPALTPEQLATQEARAAGGAGEAAA